MKVKKLFPSLFLTLASPTLAANGQMTDSLWHDSITGIATHLQTIDIPSPNTCDIAIFGRKGNGEPKQAGLQALIEDVGINALVWGWDRYVQQREWANVTNAVIKRNVNDGWVWDSDSFSGNQFAHPYHGGMFYNAAREHGLSYGVSLLYPILGSTTWELFCETNKPAINDFLSTGIGGAAIGEVTHRVSDIFFDNSASGTERVVREVFGSFLNPVRGIHRIISGEMFRVNRMNRGKKEASMPYTFQVGIGNRYIYDEDPTHPAVGSRYYNNVPFMDVHFNYGTHFNLLETGGKARAFDLFNLYALVNLVSDNPTIGELELRGRIGTYQRQLPKRWKIDVGFYQNIKYIDHFNKNGVEAAGNLPVISEAVSFGTGIYAQHPTSRHTVTHDFLLSGVPLGGAAADYYPLRRYNFGTGFSLNYRFRYDWNRHFSVSDELYFMRLFVLKGCDPEILHNYNSNPELYRQYLIDGTTAWGDKGEQSVFQNRLSISFNATTNTHLRLQYEYNYRHGNYRDYPSITGKCHEWTASITHAL